MQKNVMTRAEERRLLDAAQAGDSGALGRLAEILAGPAYRFGQTFCKNPEDAQDVMQDVLASAIRSVRTFAGRSSLSTWAYIVARNACLHMRRRRAGEPARLQALHAGEDGRPIELPDPRHDPARDLEQSEVREALRLALADLPRPQREAVLLRDVEGLSTVRAAAILKITERSLKSRLHRGRTALRAALRRQGIFEGRPDGPAGDGADRSSRPPAGADGGAQNVPAALRAGVAAPARCPDTARLLSRHLEGDLDPALCARLEQHVRRCPDCGQVCDSLKATLRQCRDWGHRRPPASVRQAMTRALRETLVRGTPKGRVQNSSRS